MHILVGSYLIIATYVTASELPCFKLRNRRIPHIGNSHEQHVRIEVVAGGVRIVSRFAEY
jgi:hypothetical protein